MTVSELMSLLQVMPPDAVVVWDYDSYEYFTPVHIGAKKIPASFVHEYRMKPGEQLIDVVILCES